jgi:hypothetical protein
MRISIQIVSFCYSVQKLDINLLNMKYERNTKQQKIRKLHEFICHYSVNKRSWIMFQIFLEGL